MFVSRGPDALAMLLDAGIDSSVAGMGTQVLATQLGS